MVERERERERERDIYIYIYIHKGGYIGEHKGRYEIRGVWTTGSLG